MERERADGVAGGEEHERCVDADADKGGHRNSQSVVRLALLELHALLHHTTAAPEARGSSECAKGDYVGKDVATRFG